MEKIWKFPVHPGIAVEKFLIHNKTGYRESFPTYKKLNLSSLLSPPSVFTCIDSEMLNDLQYWQRTSANLTKKSGARHVLGKLNLCTVENRISAPRGLVKIDLTQYDVDTVRSL